MNQSTLVLNKSFAAVHICGMEKVMAMMFTGEAEAVDENLQCYNFKDWVELSAMMGENRNGFVNTVTMKIAVPDVVRLLRFNKLPQRQVKFTRENVYRHYKKKCCYCAKTLTTFELTYDHVIPRAKGGKSEWKNIVLSCKPCNARKADKTPGEAGMRLLVQPSRPEWKGSGTLCVMAPAPMPVSWQQLIDRAFWDSELDPD